MIGIFHLFVQMRDPITRKFSDSKRFDVLHVRWFGRNLQADAQGGWKAKRLHRIGFLPAGSPDAFGFLDPTQVIRGVHLIPRFAGGRTVEYLGPSIIRKQSEGNEDWVNYYVNCFVDRDMFMRFRGGGVGHKSTNENTRCAYEDRDVMDTTDYEAADDDDEEVLEGSDDQASDEDEGNLSNLGESESDGSDNSDVDADPLDEYEVEGFAGL